MEEEFCTSCFEPITAGERCGACDGAEAPKPTRKPGRAQRRSRQRPIPKPAQAAPSSAPAQSPWSLAGVLLAAVVAIRLQGRYRKTSEANSTRNLVCDLIASETLAERALDSDADKARAVQSWLSKIEPDNDYTRSLSQAYRTSIKAGSVADRDIGRLASAVSAAERDAAREAEAQAEGAPVFIGTPGAKGMTEVGLVEIDRVNHFPDRGYSLVKGEALETGARVAWFARGDVPAVGAVVEVRAKIKAHSRRYGETTLNYVKTAVAQPEA